MRPFSTGLPQGPSARLTVALLPSYPAAEVRGAALGRLDARLLHLHARTRLVTVLTVLHDSARLLGAHLTYRCADLTVQAGPQDSGGGLHGQTLASACHRLLLPGLIGARPHAVLAGTLRGWSSGTLLVVRAGQVAEHLNLADPHDRSQVPGWLVPQPQVSLHAHRLRGDGRLEQCAARDGFSFR